MGLTLTLPLTRTILDSTAGGASPHHQLTVALLSIYSCIYLCIYVSIYLCIHVSIYLSIYLSTRVPPMPDDASPHHHLTAPFLSIHVSIYLSRVNSSAHGSVSIY